MYQSPKTKSTTERSYIIPNIKDGGYQISSATHTYFFDYDMMNKAKKYFGCSAPFQKFVEEWYNDIGRVERSKIKKIDREQA